MENENDRSGLYAEISAERDAQDAQWGGARHDDEHRWWDFLGFIEHQVNRARECQSSQYGAGRERFVKIAALAIAAIEMMDRGAAK